MWLHDGNLRFLQGKHIALVVVSTLFALFYIVPFTLLLLFAPVLRRVHNYRMVRLVQRLKPLLDAFQGPYKDRFHWWPGLMLIIRIILFVVLTANTKHDPRLSALFVGVAAALLMFSMVLYSLVEWVLQHNSQLTDCHAVQRNRLHSNQCAKRRKEANNIQRQFPAPLPGCMDSHRRREL